ncbi:XTP/dITP diphosphohydrolase [Allocatelliglobosispora scoriae]|uniref:XTP/dITP diphosphohydrolase n=1 Tax=Allocatelliglobosispora scoriae TaxID=643052 RepID=A0A841BXV6_9ACTN|nr:XTP/dITP diphosphohydrolase [Allocatelliglobosispora scoriae]
MTRRIVLLVTSPRLPAGLLSAEAWDACRAHPVLAAQESDQTTALRIAGAEVTILPVPSADALLATAGQTVIWLAGPTGDERLARELGMRLAREPSLAEMELMYGSWDPPGARLLDAVAVTERLSADPWRAAQTHRSLARFMLEEAREAVEAIETDDHEALREELGDVLLQVLIHARMAEELPGDERFTIDDVAGDYVAKMIRRNPHIFGGPEHATDDMDQILEVWERVKAQEKAERAGRRAER